MLHTSTLEFEYRDRSQLDFSIKLKVVRCQLNGLVIQPLEGNMVC